MRERVLFNDVYIAGRDASASVHIATEIRARDRLQRLRFAQVRVAARDHAASVDITEQQAHRDWHRGTKASGGISHIRYANSDRLGVRYARDIDDEIVCVIRIDVAGNN